MRIFTLLLFVSLLLSKTPLKAQSSLFDMKTIQTVEIYFGISNWDYRMDTAMAVADTYTVADSVFVNGIKFDSCGVRYKGNSSYKASQNKNPLHIKLNLNKKKTYNGITDLKLANENRDPSMVREVVAYEVLRKYMDAPQSNFCRVYVNGKYYGLMTNDEDIGEDFLTGHYYTNTHTFIKCNPVYGQPGSNGGSNLAYNGTSVSSYNTRYQLQSDISWTDLINLCDTLNNKYASFNSIADIDRFLWMLAFNNVTVNLDSYSGGIRQNYYLYRNHNNQWIPTIWDLNECFGAFTNPGTNGGGMGGSLNLSGMQNMTPLLHQSDNNWPLLNKFLNDPFYLKMYIAHMRTINNENFINGDYKTSAAALYNLVDSSVKADANSLFTYKQFQSALTNSTSSGGPGGSTCGVYELMDTRATYLSNTSQLALSPPSISGVSTAPSSPAYGNTFNIVATVNNVGTGTVYAGYRYKGSDRFVRVVMYDDGAHGDGASGDKVFGAGIMASSLSIQYYIYAENANAGMFSPERAEHEFYIVKPSIAQAAASDIVINEFESDNKNGITNEVGKHKDWIELYNKTNSPLGLSNLYLSDKSKEITKWNFPADAMIQPKGYLLVWADDMDSTLIDYHCNFNLNNKADTIFLASASGIADSITFKDMNNDEAMARCPDGTGSFQSTVVLTPNASNTCSLVGIAQVQKEEGQFRIYPNPANDLIYIESPVRLSFIQVINMSGQEVYSYTTQTEGRQEINIGGLSEGIYILKANNTLVGKFMIMH